MTSSEKKENCEKYSKYNKTLFGILDWGEQWRYDSRWWSGRSFLAIQVIFELSPEFDGTSHVQLLREEHARWREGPIPKGKSDLVSMRIRKTDMARTQ